MGKETKIKGRSSKPKKINMPPRLDWQDCTLGTTNGMMSLKEAIEIVNDYLGIITGKVLLSIGNGVVMTPESKWKEINQALEVAKVGNVKSKGRLKTRSVRR